MGYQPEQWHDLFVAIAGASAALAGLIFVAVSLNLQEIMKANALISVAARSISVLVALMLMSTFALTPGQHHVALGVEILALGAVLFAGVMTTTVRTMIGRRPPPRAKDDNEVQPAAADEQKEPADAEKEHVIRLEWKIGQISMSLFCTAPMVVAGISVWAGAGGGLYWALAEVVTGLIGSVLYAWVLLIEILR